MGLPEEAPEHLQSACRTDVFAERRQRHIVSDAVPQRYCDHKNRKDQVFEPAEDAGDPGSGNLRDRDLMQQLLEKPEGTEPSADSPAQNHTI